MLLRVLYAPVEKAHRQRGVDSGYGKPMDYVEMVNTRVMGGMGCRHHFTDESWR